VVVIVDHIVEGAVDTIIDVESLGVALASFSTINFSSNCGRPAHEITSRFSDVSKLSRPVIANSCLEDVDSLSDSASDIDEGRHVRAVGSTVVTREATTDVNHRHFLHANLISGLKNIGGMIKCNCVRLWVTTA
jgi:hypothetical protein